MAHLLRDLQEKMPEAADEINTIITYYYDHYPGNQLGMEQHLYSVAGKVAALKNKYPKKTLVIDDCYNNVESMAKDYAPREINFNNSGGRRRRSTKTRRSKKTRRSNKKQRSTKAK